MKRIKSSKYELLYNKKDTEKPNVILEIYKGKLYSNLLKNFIKVCSLNFSEKIFTIKKSFIRTLTNLLSSWLFSLYSDYDFSGDYFFPSKYNNTDIIKDVLKDYCSLDKNLKDVDSKINNTIDQLLSSYELILSQLEIYKTSEFFITNKNNFKLSKYIIIEKRDKNVKFYKFKVSFNVPIFINNIKLKNILNNIIIPVNEYNRMKKVFTGFPDELDNIIFIILFRYQLLGSNNHQLAVLPNILNEMKNDFDLSIECFASAINTESNIFCSIYYDIEKYFGSIGSFFSIELKKGFYSFNPPYQIDIIEKGINRIFDFFKNTNQNLGFIITIPIWDNFGKKYMEEKNSKNNNDIINYNDFKIIEEIKSKPYFYGLRMVSKNEFTYIDHNFHLFKNTTIQNTYIIILANFKNNYIEKVNNYDFFNYKNI